MENKLVFEPTVLTQYNWDKYELLVNYMYYWKQYNTSPIYEYTHYWTKHYLLENNLYSWGKYNATFHRSPRTKYTFDLYQPHREYEYVVSPLYTTHNYRYTVYIFDASNVQYGDNDWPYYYPQAIKASNLVDEYIFTQPSFYVPELDGSLYKWIPKKEGSHTRGGTIDTRYMNNLPKKYLFSWLHDRGNYPSDYGDVLPDLRYISYWKPNYSGSTVRYYKNQTNDLAVGNNGDVFITSSTYQTYPAKTNTPHRCNYLGVPNILFPLWDKDKDYTAQRNGYANIESPYYHQEPHPDFMLLVVNCEDLGETEPYTEQTILYKTPSGEIVRLNDYLSGRYGLLNTHYRSGSKGNKKADYAYYLPNIDKYFDYTSTPYYIKNFYWDGTSVPVYAMANMGWPSIYNDINNAYAANGTYNYSVTYGSIPIVGFLTDYYSGSSSYNWENAYKPYYGAPYTAVQGANCFGYLRIGKFKVSSISPTYEHTLGDFIKRQTLYTFPDSGSPYGTSDEDSGILGNRQVWVDEHHFSENWTYGSHTDDEYLTDLVASAVLYRSETYYVIDSEIVIGDYICDVSTDDENTYPHSGVSDNDDYWYEYYGHLEITNGHKISKYHYDRTTNTNEFLYSFTSYRSTNNFNTVPDSNGYYYVISTIENPYCGDLIETVSSKIRDLYPDNGSKDGYYYLYENYTTNVIGFRRGSETGQMFSSANHSAYPIDGLQADYWYSLYDTHVNYNKGNFDKSVSSFIETAYPQDNYIINDAWYVYTGNEEVIVGQLVIDETNLMGGINYTQEINPSEDLMIGAGGAAQVDFTIYAPDANAATQYLGKDFTYYVKMTSDSDWRQVGVFTLTKAELPDKQTAKIEGFDYIYKFDTVIDGWLDSLHFPMTLGQLFNSLCQYVGCEAYSTEFNNSNFIVNDNFEAVQITGRTILQYITEVSGGFCVAEPDGRIHIKQYSIPPTGTINLGNDSYVKYTHEIYNVPVITSVVVRKDDEDEGVESNV